MPLHAFLILSCFYFLLVLWAVILKSVKPVKWIKLLFIGTHLALSAWIILLHILAAIGFFFWSDQVSIQALIDYIPSLPIIAAEAGIEKSYLFGIISFAGMIILLLWFFWSLPLIKLCNFLHNHSFTNNQIVKGILLLVAAITFFGGFKSMIQMDRMVSLRSEPFSNYLRNPSVFIVPGQSSVINLHKHTEAKENYRNLTEGFIDVKEMPNVVVILLDAARADHMSLYGYARNTTPFLDSLQNNGHLIKASFATSTCTGSLCGMTTLLSSVFFTRVHYLNYKMHEALRDIGYNTHFLLSGDHTRTYANLKVYYGDEMDTFKDGFSVSGQHPSDDEMVVRHLNQLDLSQNDNPSFLFIQLMSSHYAGKKSDKFSVFTPEYPEPLMNLVKRNNSHTVDSLMISKVTNTYDNGILQADHYVRKIFSELEDKGVLDNSIIVITSDHGEALGEDGRIGHGGDIHMAEINIPLMFYSENLFFENQNIPYATLTDIAPSIFGLLELPVPETWEGINLFGKNREYSFHLSRRKYGNNAVVLKSDNQTYLYSITRHTGDERLINLTRDPYQEINYSTSKKENIIRRARQLYQNEFGSPE